MCPLLCYVIKEPTFGVDPVSRERIWAIIEHMRDRGHSILFTTYSSDEAFQLADKVAVISDASMQCIGDPQRLQGLYDRGYTITFKLKYFIFSSYEVRHLTKRRLTEFKNATMLAFKYEFGQQKISYHLIRAFQKI